MSGMEAFYTNLVRVEQAGAPSARATAVQLCPATVAMQDATYQELLMQLTKVTLDDLKSLKSMLGWQSWWSIADST